jgi:hypothetical protein
VHDGGASNSGNVIVGPTKFEHVTTEHGVTDDDALEAWTQAMGTLENCG